MIQIGLMYEVLRLDQYLYQQDFSFLLNLIKNLLFLIFGFLITKLCFFLLVILGMILKQRFTKMVVLQLVREVFLLIIIFLFIKTIFFVLIAKFALAIIIFFIILNFFIVIFPALIILFCFNKNQINFKKNFNYLVIKFLFSKVFNYLKDQFKLFSLDFRLKLTNFH